MPNIDNEIKRIMQLIKYKGYEVYIVGGAVRDKIIGVDINDYDLCTNMPFSELKKLIPQIHIMKPNSFRNTAVFNIKGIQVEISSYKGNNIDEDLSKRDFRINTLLEDKDGNIIDKLNAMEDMNNKQIKLVNPNGEIFDENPVRILRAIRLSSKLGYTIDKNSYLQMLKRKALLKSVISERIITELKKILSSKYFQAIFPLFIPFLLEIIPELNSVNLNQINMELQGIDGITARLYIVLKQLPLETISNILNRLKIDKKIRYDILDLKKQKRYRRHERKKEV